MVLQGSRIASYFNTPAAIILFFVLVFFGNTALGLIRRSWMLNRAELALIYIMWIVATAIPEWGLTSFLLTDITSPIYNATPENNWSELLHPFIPDWIIPHHDFAQIQNFFEGAPKGQGIPWMLWLRPLAYWIPFVLALYLAMISIMVILRKQWIEHERLVYPLALPATLAMGAGAVRLWLGSFREKSVALRLVFSMLTAVLFLLAFSLGLISLRLAFYAQAKAFYLLCAVLPLAMASAEGLAGRVRWAAKGDCFGQRAFLCAWGGWGASLAACIGLADLG